MKKSENINRNVSEFVDSVMKNKNVDANGLLEKIVKSKVEKRIRKVLKTGKR